MLDGKTRKVAPISAFQLFFAIHCAGVLALLAADGEKARAILSLLALDSNDIASEGFGTAPWRLVTHAFLHLHPLEFIVSTSLLLAFGGTVERHVGAVRFSIFYLAAAAGTAVLHVLVDQMTGALVANPVWTPGLFLGGIGAGGALLAAYVLIEPSKRVLGAIPAPGVHLVVLSCLFAVCAYLDQDSLRRTDELLKKPLSAAFTLAQYEDEQLALTRRANLSVTHLLGLLVGPLALLVDLGLAHVVAHLRLRRQIRTLEEELEARARVEQLLEKISRDGLDALSRRERKFLKYASARFYPSRVLSE